MTKQFTVAMPDDLYEKLEALKKDMNVSGIFQKALRMEIEKREGYSANRVTAAPYHMPFACDGFDKENNIFYDEVMSPFF